MSLDAQPGDIVRITLAPDADAMAQARRLVTRCAQQSGLDEERSEELVQAAAELMAVGGRLRRVLAVGVQEHHDRLTVLVDLTGSETIDLTDEAAALLNGLSREWGWRHLPGCTQAWCEVTTPGPRRSGPSSLDDDAPARPDGTRVLRAMDGAEGRDRPFVTDETAAEAETWADPGPLPGRIPPAGA